MLEPRVQYPIITSTEGLLRVPLIAWRPGLLFLLQTKKKGPPPPPPPPPSPKGQEELKYASSLLGEKEVKTTKHTGKEKVQNTSRSNVVLLLLKNGEECCFEESSRKQGFIYIIYIKLHSLQRTLFVSNAVNECPARLDVFVLKRLPPER